MFDIKVGDILFYNSDKVEVGIVTRIALDGWATVINNMTKTTVAPVNFIEIAMMPSGNLKKQIETFK